MSEHGLAARFAHYRDRVDHALDQRLPAAAMAPATLHEAMRYSVFNGGKRVRPLLVYGAGEALRVDSNQLDGAACAIELIHAYSLIHDDLPAMDDDDLRRGKATCHIAYGEATAILAGDALQAAAFEAIAADPHLHDDPVAARDATAALAVACGSLGMAGGQALDLAATGRQLTYEALKQMHALKTGALIVCALELAAHLGHADEAQFDALQGFGRQIGLAFQIQDDILDVEGHTARLGKPSGSDQAANKATFPACLGLTRSRQLVTDLLGGALRMLDVLPGDASLLEGLAHFIVERDQ